MSYTLAAHPAPKAIAGRYQLEAEVARGGMGTVWRARDIKLGRTVALKLMCQELMEAPDSEERFEREAMAAAQLRSHHIVQVFDYGLADGLPFIVMELLDGENLGTRLRRDGSLSLGETAMWIGQLCKGLKAAHNEQLIHRDLKPTNLFLARRDDEEVLIILDFGVVKALGDLANNSDATISGMLLGTPQYMSPEQSRGKREIDARSDLWSAAVIAFRMLTGANPFRGDSVGDVVLKICSDSLPKIHDYNPALPQTLDAFFERSLAREPDKRFQTAEDLASALFHIAEDAGYELAPGLLSAEAPRPSWPTLPGPQASPALSQVASSHAPQTRPAGLPSPTPMSTTLGARFGNPKLATGAHFGRMGRPLWIAVGGTIMAASVGAALWFAAAAAERVGADSRDSIPLQAGAGEQPEPGRDGPTPPPTLPAEQDPLNPDDAAYDAADDAADDALPVPSAMASAPVASPTGQPSTNAATTAATTAATGPTPPRYPRRTVHRLPPKPPPSVKKSNPDWGL